MIEKFRIKAIALNSGFKLKEQPDGNMDLNPYVYEFAKLLELAVLYDRNREIKERFEILADNFEYEISEDSKNYWFSDYESAKEYLDSIYDKDFKKFSHTLFI